MAERERVLVVIGGAGASMGRAAAAALSKVADGYECSDLARRDASPAGPNVPVRSERVVDTYGPRPPVLGKDWEQRQRGRRR